MPSRPVAVMTFEHICSQCGNVWRSDVEKPKQCPSMECWSRKWDKPGPFSPDGDTEQQPQHS